MHFAPVCCSAWVLVREVVKRQLRLNLRMKHFYIGEIHRPQTVCYRAWSGMCMAWESGLADSCDLQCMPSVKAQLQWGRLFDFKFMIL